MGWKGCMDGQGEAKDRHGSIEAGNYRCEGIRPLKVTTGVLRASPTLHALQRSEEVGFVLPLPPRRQRCRVSQLQQR